jgi:GGDEF domain-containing protein
VLVSTDLSDSSMAGAQLARVRAAFDAPYVLDGVSLTVTASTGLAMVQPDQSPQDRLLAAHAALKDAKAHAPGSGRVWTRALELSAVRQRVELALVPVTGHLGSGEPTRHHGGRNGQAVAHTDRGC